MDIPINAEVYCTDGECGRSTAIVFQRDTEQVTHVVVRRGDLLGVEHLVPIDLITESTPSSIHLRCSQAELEGLDSFTETEYVVAPGGFGGYPGDATLLWPYTGAMDSEVPIENEVVPEGEQALHRGAHVHATDGHVGKVDELIIDPSSNRISHVVLREGHLWGKKELTIPVAQVERVEDDTVYLTLSKEQVAALPSKPAS